VTRKRKVLGRYIVADPKICHGKPTFKGTRILVRVVLELVADGLSWKRIADGFDGKIDAAAIEEAVQLASRALEDHACDYGAVEEHGVPA
jgi:uncharacterized protein (DUF433 family)